MAEMAETYRPTQRQRDAANINGELDRSVSRGLNLPDVRVLMAEFAEEGYSPNIARLADGYRHEDADRYLPFTYASPDMRTTQALMIATRKPIQEIRANEKYLDQSPDVLVQWSRKHTGKIGETILEREELEEIQDGVFIKRIYRNVSKFGAFDGQLVGLLILSEDRQLKVEDCPDKGGYQVNGYELNKENKWGRPKDKTTTSLLNGVEKLVGMYKEDQIEVIKYLPAEKNPTRLKPVTLALPPQPGRIIETRSWASLERTCQEMGLDCFRGGNSLWAVKYRESSSGKRVISAKYQWDRNGRLVRITDCNLEPTGSVAEAYKGISHIVSNYYYDVKGRLVEDERLLEKTDGAECLYGGNKYHYKEGSNEFEVEFDLPESAESAEPVILDKAA